MSYDELLNVLRKPHLCEAIHEHGMGGDVTCIVPYTTEGSRHCSVMILSPREVVFIDPYGGSGRISHEVTLARGIYNTLDMRVSTSSMRLQDASDMANCGPWVAIIVAWAHEWDGGARKSGGRVPLIDFI